MLRGKASVVVLVAVVLAVPGCGGGDGGGASTGTIPAAGDAAAGAAVFEDAGCGLCHAFTAAGSTADFGPNLDESELSYAAVYTKTRDGGGEMLAYGDKLTPRKLADVAQFVVDERDGG